MENNLQQTNATTREFKLQLIQHITNNFSEEHVIGRGGYGVVYKGVLEEGEEIAVKRLHHLPGLDDKEFRNEFNNLMRAQHKNIVRLIGYCYDIGHQRIKLNGEYIFAHMEERLLCFEYLEGGSLDKYVSDGSCGLDWHTCSVIIRGVSEGLNYLHNGSKDPIYHLDLKPSNIMLDKGMMPKIGDFGLSRLCPSADTCTTIKIIGTPGYMPPEYIERCQITSKFDIFSLGVIIIQIMAGRDGYFKLADMTSQEFIKLVHENWLKRLNVTVSSHTSLEVKRCIEIALKCVEVDRVKRPTVAEVFDELNKIYTSNGSLPGKVTNLQSKQAFKHASSAGSRRSIIKHKVRGVCWRRLLPLLWVVGWSFASLWIFFFVNSQVVEKRRELLVGMCDERARMLQEQFIVSTRHFHALAILVSTFHHSKSPSAMDQMTFADYAERTKLPLTSGLLYAVRVTHTEREQFERQQGWSIRHRRMYSSNFSSGTGVEYTAQEYAPVIFADDAYKNFISFDLLSTEDRENIIQATESGALCLTAPFKLLNNRFGVILTYTLYKYDLPATARTQERREAAVGYLSGILYIDAHTDKVLQQLADNKSIMVNVYDTTHQRPILMHGSIDTGSCIACISHNSTLSFGDPSRRHEMHCRFTQRSPWPWAMACHNIIIWDSSYCLTGWLQILRRCQSYPESEKRFSEYEACVRS